MRGLVVAVFAGLAAGCGSLNVTIGPSVEEAPPLDPPPVVVAEPGEFACATRPAVIPFDQLEGRFRAADGIGNPFEKNAAFIQLAHDAARLGDAPDRAALAGFVRKCVNEVRNPFERSEATKASALALAARGMTAEGTELAKEISNPFERDAALKQLAAGRK